MDTRLTFIVILMKICCFQPLVITHKVAMNVVLCVFYRTYALISIRYIPRRGIAGLQSICMFSFAKYHQAFFQSVIHIDAIRNNVSVLVIPYYYQTPSIFSLSVLAILLNGKC